MAPSAAPVVILAYDGVAADEARVVVDVLSGAGVPVTVASVESAPVTSYHGRVVPAASPAELGPLSALVVPGGMGVRRLAGDEPLLGAVRHLARSARWLGATSTGSVVLAAAGVVDEGSRFTTHWLAGELITDPTLHIVDAPFVADGRLLTASGLASTGTLALRLVGLVAGVDAEAAARTRQQPTRPTDPRYRRRALQPVRGGAGPGPWWRDLARPGRRRVGPLSHPVDPHGRADVVIVVLDGDDVETR